MSKEKITQYKDLIIAAPSPNHSRKECQDYLINGHAYRAMGVQAIKDVMVRYTMNEVLTSEEKLQTLYQRKSESHLIIEHVTISREAYLTALDDSEYLEKVRPDEAYMTKEFMRDLPDFYSCEERVAISDEKKDYSGEYRVFDFLKKKENISQETFTEGIEEIGKAMCGNSAYRSVVHKRVHNFIQDLPPIFGYAGIYDAIIETFTDDLSLLEEFHPQIREMGSHLVEDNRCCTMLTRQHIYVPAETI